MPTTLPLFSRRQLAIAALGFLAGLMILLGCALAIFGALRVMPDPALQRYGGLLILPLILMSAVIGIVGFFWTLSQISVWSAQGSRLAHICYWTWMGTVSALIAVEFLFGRVINPVNLVMGAVLFLLRPKPGGAAWKWSMISILERQEPRPFRWGVCAALGFQIMAMALGAVGPQASPQATVPLHGLVGLVIGCLAGLAMGFVLGALMQAWTKQRWPVRSIGFLVLIAAIASFALRGHIPAGISFASWAAAAWSLGLLAGDFSAAHEEPEPLPVEAGA